MKSPCWSYEKGITQSFTRSFRKCRLLTFLGYVQGWTPVKDPIWFRHGHAFHYALEVAYRSGVPFYKSEDIKILLEEHFHKKEAEKPIPSSPGMLAENDGIIKMAAAILPMYFMANCDDFKNNWIETEIAFEVPYAGTYLRGKLDGLYETNRNKLTIMDHKCLSMFDKQQLESCLGFDTQVNLYAYAIYCLYGRMPKQVVYNIIKRPRKGKKESVDEWIEKTKTKIFQDPTAYFVRISIPLDINELNDWVRKQLKALCKEIKQWDNAGYPIYPYNEDAWFGKYGKEALFEIVHTHSTCNFYRRSIPFPELEE